MCGVQTCKEKNKPAYEFELQVAEINMQEKAFLLDWVRF